MNPIQALHRPVKALPLAVILALALGGVADLRAQTAAMPPSSAAATDVAVQAPDAGRLGFGEVWAYLMDGEEKYLPQAAPISDLCYFGAGITSQGRLGGVPNRGLIKAFPGKVHLVLAELGNYALLHFAMEPSLPIRDLLIADIAEAAKGFDGVQIDFESIASRDLENFYAFLEALKAALGPTCLSVALPACTSEGQDRLGYAKVAQRADRIMVMAYDEHWSGSSPGPVASLDWSRKVAAYALAKVGADKLIMGSPFYGRAWTDKSLARAYKYSSLAELLSQKGLEASRAPRDGGVPYVEYQESVNVKVYFEDAASAQARLGDYRAQGVRRVAFWRLGQEDPATWALLGLEP